MQTNNLSTQQYKAFRALWSMMRGLGLWRNQILNWRLTRTEPHDDKFEMRIRNK